MDKLEEKYVSQMNDKEKQAMEIAPYVVWLASQASKEEIEEVCKAKGITTRDYKNNHLVELLFKRFTESRAGIAGA